MLSFWDLHYFSFAVCFYHLCESMLKLDFAGQAETFLASEAWDVHKKRNLFMHNFKRVPIEWLQFSFIWLDHFSRPDWMGL